MCVLWGLKERWRQLAIQVVAVANDEVDFNWSISDNDDDFFSEDCALGERTITRDYLTEAQDRADSPERQMPVSYVCVCVVEMDVTFERGRLCLR